MKDELYNLKKGDLDQDEEVLVKQAIEGDAKAFGLIYDKYQPSIFRFIYLKVGHREEAEDLTHQTFLSAWQSIGEFQQRNLPISSWLYRIARNKVIDYYRTRKMTLELEKNDQESEENLATNPFESLSQKMSLEIVEKALRLLPPHYQDVLIMRFVEEMSYKEISQVIGKSQGLIRVIQFRALKKIKKIIEENEKKRDN
ncbi:MAG: ECF subfamily RNA polymerase sigma factor [Candidatus Parcubacteria bacterium]|nr:RNA polymerase sigma factor [Patescibacteria group bacterium]BCX15819.1 MAG: ECF subfamily RNA polymerase sigma factor [Candidatus Parcubacteria bacterium]